MFSVPSWGHYDSVHFGQVALTQVVLKLFCFSLLQGKKKSKSAEILAIIKAFIKHARYSSCGTAVDAESKMVSALKTNRLLPGLLRGNAVTRLPISQRRKLRLSSESCHVLLLLFWISRRNVCVHVEGREDSEHRATPLPCVCLQVTCCPAVC